MTRCGLWTGALLVLASACASSRTAPAQEPGEDENDGAELPPAEPSPFESEPAIGVGEFNACEEGSSREIALGEDIENGFSAEDVLSFVEGEHEAALRWTPPESVSVGPESGERAVFITVQRAGERAREFTPTTGPIGHGTRCEHWLEIDVTLALQTEGGALNEAIAGTLYTSDARVAYFRAHASDDEFGGELTVRSKSEGIGQLARYELYVAFSEHGASGALHGVWVTPQGDYELEDAQQLASFGPATCNAGRFATALDDIVAVGADESGVTADKSGVSARELIDRIDGIDSLPLTWQDGARTTATLRFTPDEPGACVAISSTSADDATQLTVRGKVSLESDDSRLVGRWPAILAQWVGSRDTTLSLDRTRMPDGTTTTPAELGYPKIERGQLTSISASLDITLSGEGPVGALSLAGFHCGSGSLDSICEYTPVQLESAVIGP